MDLDRVTLDQDRGRPGYPDGGGWRTVEEHVLAGNNFFENGPNFWDTVFNETTSATDVVRELLFEELGDDKRTEELERHVLGSPHWSVRVLDR